MWTVPSTGRRATGSFIAACCCALPPTKAMTAGIADARQGDLQADRLTHTLKGMAGNIGAGQALPSSSWSVCAGLESDALARLLEPTEALDNISRGIWPPLCCGRLPPRTAVRIDPEALEQLIGLLSESDMERWTI